jgi:hypothetical protein
MGKEVVSPLRQRMIEDMNARKLGKHSQRSHIHSCKRFAAFLKRSPETATPDDIRRFQLHLIESGLSICNRNRVMTGVKFLVRVTLRRLDLAAEIYHLREPRIVLGGSSAMAAYFILDTEVRDPAGYAEYVKAGSPSVQRLGSRGRPVAAAACADRAICALLHM